MAERAHLMSIIYQSCPVCNDKIGFKIVWKRLCFNRYGLPQIQLQPRRLYLWLFSLYFTFLSRSNRIACSKLLCQRRSTSYV